MKLLRDAVRIDTVLDLAANMLPGDGEKRVLLMQEKQALARPCVAEYIAVVTTPGNGWKCSHHRTI